MKKITKNDKKEQSSNNNEQEFKEFKNINFEEDEEDDKDKITNQELENNKKGKTKTLNKKVRNNKIAVNKNSFFNKKEKKRKQAKYKDKIQKRESFLNDIPNKPNIKIKRKINKKRIGLIILLTFIVCTYLGLSVYHLIKNPTDTVMVIEGSLSEEETVEGYIIRDETVIKGQNYKNGMVEIKSEGSKVANGDPIFRYYSSGEDDLKKKIADLDAKIQEAMEKNDESIPSSDVRLLDSQIENTLDQVMNTNDIQQIKEYKKSIAEKITKKAKIAGELSPAGSYLKKLIDERSSYENELNSGAEYVNATRSGIVSYRIDGLEETLTPNDFSKINKDFLKNLNLKTGQIISSSNEEGKIVNNFICYIACTSKTKEANEAKVGDKVKLALPSSKEVDAVIEYINKEQNDEVTLIFSFTEGIEELLNYRKVSIDIIWWDTKGYKVPNTCIIEENGLNYVIRNKAGYLDKVLVKVQKATENYSIVKNYSTSEIEELDIDKNVSTSIILYDELLLKPSTEQINNAS